MHWASAIFLMVAVVAVWSWLAVEIYRFARGKSLINGKQLALRAANAVAVLGVAALLMWGTNRTWPAGAEGARQFTIFIAACGAGVLLIMILAIRDWRIVLREKHRWQARIYQRMDSDIHDPEKEEAD